MWNSTKISVTPGIHLTRGGHVQRQLTSEPSGWPASQSPWPAGPGLQPPMIFLGGDAIQEAVKWSLRPRVSGHRASWLASHGTRSADQHLAN
jgi:hypothetical protein